MSIQSDGPAKEVVVVQSTAPIPVTDLKRKFTENVEFHIDVDNSRLKNNAFITYLSNLNISTRLVMKDADVMQELLLSYMNSTVLVNIPDLEDLAINVLLAATFRPFVLPFDPVPFIASNYEVVDMWLRRTDSIPLYYFQCKEDTKGEVLNYPEDKDESLAGLNFVKLIDHELFPVLCMGIEEHDLNWNKLFFNEYCFAGDNLFKYFASPNNPYFLMLIGEQCPEEMQKVFDQTLVLAKEIEDVSSNQQNLR